MESLESLGSRTGLDPVDIRNFKKRRRKYKVLSLIAGILMVILAFLLGLFLGVFISNKTSSSPSENSYPFAIPFFATVGSMKGGKIKAFIPMTLIAFLTGMSSPVFGQSTYYGVFKRGLS